MSVAAAEPDEDDIADDCWLRNVFELDRNDLTSDVLYVAAKAITELLEDGKKIGFVPSSDYLGGTHLRSEWDRWLVCMPSALSHYKGKTRNTSEIAYNPRKGVGDGVVDILIYKDPAAPFSDGQSSKIQGLKLILFTLTLIPNLNGRGIDLEKVASDFWSGIKMAEVFPYLSLNFVENTSLSKLIDECELLIKEKYRSGRFRDFLSSIRDAALVIQGWRIGPRDRKKTKAKGSMRGKNASGGKIESLSVRFRSYHSSDIPDEQAYVGDMISLQGEDGGEEPVLGVIEAPEANDDGFLPNNLSAAITQTKSKYWLQLYHEAIPWSSRGINPLTRLKLVEWIKANDIVESLILSLMLLTGNRYEAVLELVIGEDGDITLEGVYTRHYMPPENAYNPSDDLSQLLEKSTEILRLNLPALVSERLSCHCVKTESGVSLLNALCLDDAENTKNSIQKIIKKLIRNGANGLAIDRIPLALNKKISEITGDDAAGYILSSKENEMAPVSTYYSAFEVSDLEAIHRKAVTELFYESNLGR